MKPGTRDIKAYIQFTEDELEILQANTHYMAESFGLDHRIERLKGKRKVGFYIWDLECLECAIDFIKKDEEYIEDAEILEELENKVKTAMKVIEGSKD
ncbi:MAG: hypothetical protein R3E32_08350 [Chitinophagales bacterium]